MVSGRRAGEKKSKSTPAPLDSNIFSLSFFNHFQGTSTHDTTRIFLDSASSRYIREPKDLDDQLHFFDFAALSVEKPCDSFLYFTSRSETSRSSSA